MISEAEVLRAARDLIERRGKYALEAARERVKELERDGDYGAVDTAMRVLSACERLLDGKGEPGPTSDEETVTED